MRILTILFPPTQAPAGSADHLPIRPAEGLALYRADMLALDLTLLR
jgi:hypothetical protein